MSSKIPASILQRVRRPARYVGGEPGQVLKDPAAVRARVALCFPDAYEIGMSHLGLRILYSLLNRDARVWCERAFAPLPDMEAALRAAAHPLTTLESGTPLRDLDVLGFSLQHELCATNVLQMLDLGGVPLRAADRAERDPLVLAGGPSACHPEPLAPFFDAVALGDGEELAGRIALAWVDARRGGATRAQALEALAAIPGVYVPALVSLHEDPASRRLVADAGQPVARALRVGDLDEFPFPADGPVPLTEVVFDRAVVEIARGCSGGCRFCQAGMVYRPARERSPAAVIESLRAQIRQGGYDEASLTSLSSADYSQIGPLLGCAAATLGAEDVALSVSSLRAHGLDAALSEALAAVRTSSLTLAPEAATQRLRDVINKNITEDDILRGALASLTRSRRRLKLYFMIGLPTETDDDVRAIADLAVKILRHAAGGGKSGKGAKKPTLTVSASTFVPKPHTPLQWAPAIGPEEVEAKQSLLRSLLRPARIELRVHDARLSMLEAILARADRRAADLVETAYRHGARFDGWDEHFADDAWRRALDEWPLDPASQRAAIPLDARLPWDHIDAGPSLAYLRREHRRAMAATTTSPCLRPGDDAALVCNACGLACDLDAEQRRLDRCRESAASLASPPGPLPAGLTPPTPSPSSVERGSSKPGASSPLSASAGEGPGVRPRRVRLVFEKTGDLIWVGHLDTVRLVSRLLRRAGVRLAYSHGFHPKPKLSFAAPLPLGASGLAEVLDLGLADDTEPAALVERLRALAPAGLAIRAARALEPDELPATRALAGAVLVVASPGLPDDLDAAVAAVLGRDRLEAVREGKGAVDFRSSLLELEPCRDAALRARCGLEPESPRAVVARVSLGRGASIRPEDLLGWLGVDPGAASSACRAALLREPLPAPLE